MKASDGVLRTDLEGVATIVHVDSLLRIDLDLEAWTFASKYTSTQSHPEDTRSSIVQQLPCCGIGTGCLSGALTFLLATVRSVTKSALDFPPNPRIGVVIGWRRDGRGR